MHSNKLHRLVSDVEEDHWHVGRWVGTIRRQRQIKEDPIPGTKSTIPRCEVINRLRVGHTLVTHSYLTINSIQEPPLRRPICSRAVLTVPYLLIQCIDLENARLGHFENVNNLTLKLLLGDRAPINKLVAYLKTLECIVKCKLSSKWCCYLWLLVG